MTNPAMHSTGGAPVTGHVASTAPHAQQVAPPTPSGAALPTDPMQLMRQLRAAARAGDAQGAAGGNKGGAADARLKRQEQQREQVECQLMEFEDYTHTEEGVYRAKALDNRIQMETEDLFSSQMEAYYKEQKQHEFRDRVRREVEERQRQEALEREHKKKLAEERRQAVLDRIKRKKEEEEERIRQAEREKQLVEEEKQRVIRKIEERMRREQQMMSEEDDLSRLAEDQYKDELERRRWKEREAAELAAWELLQRARDEEDKQARLARAADLEAKKQKLAELRKTQQADAIAASNDTVIAIREEQQKLAKQMRIQNKAKFVSKRTKDGVPAADEPSASGLSMNDSLHRGPEGTIGGNQIESLLDSKEVAKTVLSSSECEAIAAVTSENDLRELQKQVMVEKRKLRLESLQGGGENSAEIKQQLDVLVAKEALIQQQIDVVVKKEPAAGSSASTSAGAGISRSVSQENRQARVKDVFEEAEAMLRKAQEALVANDRRRSQFGEDGPGAQPTVLLELQISNLLNRMPQNADDDPVGYRQKLTETLQKIDFFKRASIEADPMSKSVSALPTLLVTKSEGAGMSHSKSETFLPTIKSMPTTTEDRFNRLPGIPDTPSVDISSVVTDGEYPTESSVTLEGFDGEEDDPFSKIPGWYECMNTTMATAAHHAAFYGYAEVLEELSGLFDVFALDEKGRTPLFYAALRNQIACVTFLISIEPLWIEVGDVKGDTPLHAAAVTDSVEVLEFLLNCEVRPDICNYLGYTSAHIAKSKEVLDVLYRYGATMYCVDNENRLPLFLACRDGRTSCVEYLCRVTPPQYLFWGDADGNNGLHVAAMNGHHECVNELCKWITSLESLYLTNNKSYTAAHVASNREVLQTLYENGADLWIPDNKNRYPLFIASYFGRVDCVLFLLELGMQKKDDVISAKDIQGDTALHAACLCGHFNCVILLLFFLRDAANGAGLVPSELATRAGFTEVAELVVQIESMRAQRYSTFQIFNCTFQDLGPVLHYYQYRWTKLYDASNDCLYYFDRVTQSSQWERPLTYDESKQEEAARDAARDVLKKFYLIYNPEKVAGMNEILYMFRNRYSELFLQLANRYNVTDLSIFEGVMLD